MLVHQHQVCGMLRYAELAGADVLYEISFHKHIITLSYTTQQQQQQQQQQKKERKCGKEQLCNLNLDCIF